MEELLYPRLVGAGNMATQGSSGMWDYPQIKGYWWRFLSWQPKSPGVLSCLPSEGAGSGARPHLLSVPELCRHLAESWLTFQFHLQELLQYKRQNPAQVTSLC